MTEQERIEQLPETVKKSVRAIIERKPEDLPEKPEKNTWYTYRPEGCICSNGAPYYSTLRVGTENNLMIMFCGGGVALDAYSAARPNTIATKDGEESFYAADAFILGYITGRFGIAQTDRGDNPFRNWSIVTIAYASGDFHCGTGDFAYEDTGKGKGVCHHHGYTNYRAMVEKMRELVPNPDKLLITGYSAGGFAAAILADDVVSLFPDCENITCLVDSGAFSFAGWKKTLQEQWRAPQEICQRLCSDNFVLDCLLDLYRKHRHRIQIAFGCTYRDALLAQCEGYTNGLGHLVYSRENGDKFQRTLCKMVKSMREEIPNLALYIYNKPSPETGVNTEDDLTDHTFVNSEYVFEYSYENVKLLDWIVDTVNGVHRQIGLKLLTQDD